MAGHCTPVVGAPALGRARCDAGSDVCAARQCDGRSDHRDSCEGFAIGTETACRDPSCDGNRFVPGGFCNGSGSCAASEPVPCGLYRCAPTGCPEACTRSDQCVEGSSCVNGICTTGAYCVDDTHVDDGTGRVDDCGDYRCVAGACLKVCASTDDCATSRVCNLQSHCVSDAVGSGDEAGGCGCRAAGSRSGSGLSLFLATIALLRWRSRQRSRLRARSSASTTLPSTAR
jgi:hypothetical protein